MLTLSNKAYDTLKWISTIFLPALSVLYVALAGVWNLPYAEQVGATIMAVVLFMNALLGVAAAQYRALAGKK